MITQIIMYIGMLFKPTLIAASLWLDKFYCHLQPHGLMCLAFEWLKVTRSLCKDQLRAETGKEINFLSSSEFISNRGIFGSRYANLKDKAIVQKYRESITKHLIGGMF